MTAISVTGKEQSRGRPGAQALSLLATPFNVAVVVALAEGPLSLTDLRHAAGSPPQRTMRCHLHTLVEASVVERRRQSEFPCTVDYRLSAAGLELAGVATALSAWLATSPAGPTPLGSGGAKGAIKALAEGWATRMVHALAAGPLRLTELNSVLASFSYPSLERRLVAMRAVGQVEPVPTSGRGVPYAATDWLRKAIAPIAAAARWERRCLREQTAPIARRDVETAFLLAIPLLRMPGDASGSCRLAVRMGGAGRTSTAGAIAQVSEGAVAASGTRLDGSADAWAHGSSASWFSAVVDREVGNLELGGETSLVSELVERLHRQLAPAAATRSNQKNLSDIISQY